MTHRTVREWGRVPIGADGFYRAQADALLGAAWAHPDANEPGTNILIDRRTHLRAQQMVGMVAAPGCSLEILPKVDPDHHDGQDDGTVRRRLVRMLDVALGLDLALGDAAALARQDETLLDILINAFADALLAQVRRGLPRRYRECEDDLPALRGRLDVVRQFTRNAVRPDRLASRFDQLDADTPLMRVMAAAAAYLLPYARAAETRRKLTELRHALADIPLVPAVRLPWQQVRIDRTNTRWASLFALAKLLLQRKWQDIGHDTRAPAGPTLLFPMEKLFEAYIAALLRRACAGTGIAVSEQSGRRACLGPYTGAPLDRGALFQTRPDILLRRGPAIAGIIDTKWKMLAADPTAKKHGVGQADVYQLMAYAQVYDTPALMLLYPAVPGDRRLERQAWGIVGGSKRLCVAAIDIALPEAEIVDALRGLCLRFLDRERVLSTYDCS